jgi:hypothetical protein
MGGNLAERLRVWPIDSAAADPETLAAALCHAAEADKRLRVRTSGRSEEDRLAHVRRNFCSHLAMTGAPVRTIRELAGHAPSQRQCAA